MILKKQRVKRACKSVLEDFWGLNLLKDWIEYKAAVQIATKQALFLAHKKEKKLRFNLKRRRIRLQKKKRWKAGPPDQELEAMIATIKAQKDHLAQAENINYAYNSLAKYLILNEKPTK